MPKRSAGIIAYRFKNTSLQILLVHPGGPFYVKKDVGVWSIPKGEYTEEENPLEVAKREFEEETGNQICNGPLFPLSPVKLKSGKEILAWAVSADFDQCFIKSNEFEVEWPPRSGKKQFFPEVDKAEWFSVEEAKEKLNPAQVAFVMELELTIEKQEPDII